MDEHDRQVLAGFYSSVTAGLLAGVDFGELDEDDKEGEMEAQADDIQAMATLLFDRYQAQVGEAPKRRSRRSS